MNLSYDISRIDRLGVGVSSLCAIHCAIVPVAATVLPLLGFGFLADKRIEHTVLLVSIALASDSVCWGIRIHRQRRILVLFGAALLLMLAGRGFTEGSAEATLVVLGAALFVCGHLVNHYLCRRCQRCHDWEEGSRLFILYVFLRALVEFVPVCFRTEVIRLAFVLSRQVRIFFNHDPAHGITSLFRSWFSVLGLSKCPQRRCRQGNQADDQLSSFHGSFSVNRNLRASYQSAQPFFNERSRRSDERRETAF
jgi:hypothetical protein